MTEVVDIGGVPVTVVDTAGVRVSPADAIEAEGIARAAAARSVAALVVVVLDGSVPLTDDDRRVARADRGRAAGDRREQVGSPCGLDHARCERDASFAVSALDG